MAHESKLQEIKDRRHEAFMHKYHLIDLLADCPNLHSAQKRATETGKLQIYISIYLSSCTRTVCIS